MAKLSYLWCLNAAQNLLNGNLARKACEPDWLGGVGIHRDPRSLYSTGVTINVYKADGVHSRRIDVKGVAVHCVLYIRDAVADVLVHLKPTAGEGPGRAEAIRSVNANFRVWNIQRYSG